MADGSKAQRGGYGPQKNNVDRVSPSSGLSVTDGENKPLQKREPRSGSAITAKELKAAISLINTFVENETEAETREQLRDASDHIRRTAKRLFVIAKAIDEALDEWED